MAGRIERRIADDLIRAIYEREGWARHDRAEFASCTARAGSRYEITADPRRDRYIATPRARASVSGDQ